MNASADMNGADMNGADMHAVILAGGKGTRLRPYTTRLPKPLVPIGDEHSILEIALTQLARCGFGRVTLAIGHFGELIRSYIGDGSRWGVGIDYTRPEEVPLGTMGPVLRILDRLPDEFLVMNGDVLTDLDYANLMCRHAESGAALTVASYRREEKVDYGVLTTRDGQVLEFTEKPTFGYRVSMGIYACSKRALLSYPPGMPFGFDELVLDLLAQGKPPRDYAFEGYWFDIGRPEDYDRANAEFGLIRKTLLKEA
jgi:NDP-mannose synthase